MRIVTALALGIALLSPVVSLADTVITEGPRMTVVGEGRVTAAPDMATISLGVLAEDEQAARAVAAMSADLEAVLARLREAGISPEDLQTSGLSVQPRWSDRSYDTNGRRAIETFTASSEITVRVRDLDRLGAVLDRAARDGANLLHGLRFGLQDPQPREDDARRAAVAEAARKAALYAEAAGVTLGPILSIAEQGNARPLMMRAEMDAGVGASGVQVAAGELAVTASVIIVYALEPR
ncbi:hypothetical protein CLV78_102151 [Aliiruegeria haliotis]|uniref:Secreted protein n=1 Tax=Aliiruegeria haliotis TaxID=1280846 RepID=A0A2T0RV03_9RHOB|nr:SIMPL domain-containing protein [Aliiruegeria haliotis]PRY24977.1 hypothetical protein CLV78_102151 [Aliiruegeria haliotis]